eukprot:TRINITY_DN12892_c0_g1_i1.p3 TRINITY_DN12892_c0_g1~~TRINITY_DN12892_c0_g1_i1.p3  ORF type:complete len:71 (-),score=5.55 TRINITY_DN12892_c0_g1_i1:99-311(-)
MDENIRQDISHNDICFNLHTLEQISSSNMDVFHARVELDIFLSNPNCHIIKIIGEDFLGTKQRAGNGKNP